MVRCVLYTPKREEGRQLLSALRERAALQSDEEMNCEVCNSCREAVDRLCEWETSLIGWDVSAEEDRRALSSVRENCRDAFLLVLAAPETSPLTFLTPAIAPTSLVIRPLTVSEVNRVAGEMVSSLRRQNEESEESFVISAKNEQTRIAFHRIYYFEARGRKLYARLRNEEIGFAGTLEQLEEELPEEFRRCHRSFIVNTKKIEKIHLAQGMIELWDAMEVPLSRSYKRMIKEQ